MAITIRQIANKEYVNLGNPIDCLIQSTEVSRTNFKLRARVLVNGVQRADLRFPALGTQYFKFDIAPIVRDYGSYLLKDTTLNVFAVNFRLVLSELFTSGSVTVEQSSTTSNLYSTVDAAENWNDFIKDAIPQVDKFLISSLKAYIYTGFSYNLISILLSQSSGSVYDLTVPNELITLPLATYTGIANNDGVFTWIFNPQSITNKNQLYVLDDDGDKLTEIPILTLNPCTRFGRYGLTFKNSLGGYEPLYLVRFAHTENQSAERTYFTKNKGNRVGDTIEYKQYDIGKASTSRIIKNRIMKLTTDFMNDEQMNSFIDVINSPEVYLYDEQMTGGLLDRMTPVRVMNGSMERKYREKDGLFFTEIDIMLDDELVRYGS